MAGTFTIAVENDWILLENGVDNLGLEDGSTPLIQESATNLDLTAYIDHDSVSLKVNTIDFSLLDPPAFALHLRETIVTTNPAWTGALTAVESSDPTERPGHVRYRVTATNTTALPTDTAPFDLSESPANGTFKFLLEDGVGHFLLEDGTDFAPGIYLIEGALSYSYHGLQVRGQIDSIGTQSTHGLATVYQPGLRPGNIFKLTSTNQGYAAAPFQVNQVTVTWPIDAGRPVYLIEFGDTPQTLAAWATLTAPSPIVPVSPPVAVTAPVANNTTQGQFVPTGPVVYGQCSVGHVLYSQGCGLITIAQALFSVSVPSGHSMTVQFIGQIDFRAYAWDNYVNTPRRAVRGVLDASIYLGSWQEAPSGSGAGPRVTYDLSSAPGIALSSGTWQVAIQIDAQEFNQLEVFSAYAQAVVTTT